MLYLLKTELVTSLQSVVFSTGSCHQVGLPLGQDQGLKLVAHDQDWELDTTAIFQSLLPHSGP